MKRPVIFILAAFFLAATVLAFAQDIDVRLQRRLLPSAAKFFFVDKGNGLMYYEGFDRNKNFVGVVFTASGEGYNGIIGAAASMGPQGQILAIKILKEDETPELGGQVNDVSFLGQFLGKKPADFDSIQAVTGATVSSKAVVEMIRQKAQAIAEALKITP